MLELCEIYAKYQIKELLVMDSDVTPSYVTPVESHILVKINTKHASFAVGTCIKTIWSNVGIKISKKFLADNSWRKEKPKPSMFTWSVSSQIRPQTNNWLWAW